MNVRLSAFDSATNSSVSSLFARAQERKQDILKMSNKGGQQLLSLVSLQMSTSKKQVTATKWGSNKSYSTGHKNDGPK